MSLLYGTNMLKVNNKNTRKWCEICSTKITSVTSIDVCQGHLFVNDNLRLYC